MIWHELKNNKPLAYESGYWDGLKSDKVLVATKDKTITVAVMYEGILDGCSFCDFYDINDFELDHVIYWAKIDSPF